jgi:hypothetical protein
MNWGSTKMSSLGLYNITKAPVTIQLLSMAEVTGLIGSEKHLHVALIRQGCEILEIPFIGGGTVFFPKGEDELQSLKKCLNDQLMGGQEYIIAYEKLDKVHNYLAYYSVIAIRSNNILDLKKAFKIQKLKAFI